MLAVTPNNLAVAFRGVDPSNPLDVTQTNNVNSGSNANQIHHL